MGPPPVDPAPGQVPRRAVDPDSRAAAEPDRAAERLRLPSALPIRARAPPAGPSGARAGAGPSRAPCRVPARRGYKAAFVGGAQAGRGAGRRPSDGRPGGIRLSEPLVEVRDLVKHFPITRGIIFQRQIGAVHAVDGVSFDVLRGETLGIVGETGCGKSTAARLMMRLLEPTSGTIRFDGQDISHISRRALKPLRREV